jgi:hypothetical protein
VLQVAAGFDAEMELEIRLRHSGLAENGYVEVVEHLT